MVRLRVCRLEKLLKISRDLSDSTFLPLRFKYLTLLSYAEFTLSRFCLNVTNKNAQEVAFRVNCELNNSILGNSLSTIYLSSWFSLTGFSLSHRTLTLGCSVNIYFTSLISSILFPNKLSAMQSYLIVWVRGSTIFL